MKRGIVFLFGAGIAFSCARAMGQSVTNPSFEATLGTYYGGYVDDSHPTINNPSNPAGSGGFWQWGYYVGNKTGQDADAGLQLNTNSSVSPSADGTPQNGWINGSGNYLYQDTGALAANTQYTLTVAIAAPGGTSYGGVGAGNAQPTDSLELLNGTNLLSGTTNGAAATGTLLATSGVLTPPNGSYVDQSINFTTGSSVSGDLTVVLMEDATGAHEQGVFDDVRLKATTVPEPTTLSVLGLGSLLMLKRQHAQR